MIKKKGGYIIEVTGRGNEDFHESENQKLKVDFVIDNGHSLEHLREQIDVFLKIYS